MSTCSDTFTGLLQGQLHLDPRCCLRLRREGLSPRHAHLIVGQGPLLRPKALMIEQESIEPQQARRLLDQESNSVLSQFACVNPWKFMFGLMFVVE
jgi:hypothetical protein